MIINFSNLMSAESGLFRTERSCRGWRRRRSIGVSSTSWGQRSLGRRRHRKYHLFIVRSWKWHKVQADPTNSRRLDHVSDGESLDGLVFGRASRAVGASDRLDVAAALLVASTALC